jgi:hypothetical protein
MYYRNYLAQILDHDSKLVKYKIKLNEIDISNFTFRDTIRIDNTNYIVNKISNWNPNSLCDIELLKLENNYLKYRRADNGIPIDCYRLKERVRKNVIDLLKPDRSIPRPLGDSWKDEDDGDFPDTYQDSNRYVENSNCIISGVKNEINDAMNSQIVGDENQINTDETSENIIIIGNNNIIR